MSGWNVILLLSLLAFTTNVFSVNRSNALYVGKITQKIDVGAGFGGISFSSALKINDALIFMVNKNRGFITSASHIKFITQTKSKAESGFSMDTTSYALAKLKGGGVIKLYIKSDEDKIELYKYKTRKLIGTLDKIGRGDRLLCGACTSEGLPNIWKYVKQYNQDGFDQIWDSE